MCITLTASLEGKIVSKYCNISKPRGGGGSIHPPCTTVGVWICMYVRGLITRTVLSENNKKNFASNKRPANFALHCIEHYDHCCSLISASRTHCSYEKTLIRERELPSLPSIFSLFFFFFFFKVRKKLTPLLKPTSFAHALPRRTVGRAKLFIWGNVDPDRRVTLLSNSFSLFVNSNSLYSYQSAATWENKV